MNNEEFKNKYFTNNFYWVNENNFMQLQKIGIEFNCLNPLKENKIIEWHDGFNNLGFRTYDINNNVTVFQKEPFLLSTEKATDFYQMMNDYNALYY